MSLFRLESGRLMNFSDIERIEGFGPLSRGFNSCVTLKDGRSLYLAESEDEIIEAARNHGILVEAYMNPLIRRL